MTIAVGAALLAMTIPTLATLLVFAIREPGQRFIYNRVTGPQLAFGIVVTFAVLGLLALWLGLLVARREAERLGAPLTELSTMAERLREGTGTLEPLTTGIVEVDRISQVLAASSNEMTRALIAEREFASNASHQLRTPLAALLLRLEEIALTDDPVVVREEAQIAMAQVDRLSGVVDDLLGQPRRGPQPRSIVSLDSVLATLQREWQPAFANARRSMRVAGQRGLRVQISRAALTQILSTLVENSLAHGRGTLSVDARRSGPSVIVEVSDQGSGIPAELAPRIFERRVSSKGSGLGLALARDLAEQNYGRLELVRAEPAVFALFVSEAEAEAPSSSSPEKTNAR
ncbi:MAG: HAMP domain-containing sensor histidine kinase [Dermatophilaceae bacterium]